MKFLVRIDVQKPAGVDPNEWEKILIREKEYGETIDAKKFEHMWRIVGKYSTYCVFEVESNDELNSIISGLPLFPYITTEVVPLATYTSELD